MAYETWEDVKNFLKRQVPDVFIKRRFNFITIHYLYITGMSIFFSVVIYGIGDMPYIDALFFGSGACTQSGLNTIDINTIHTGQQVCLYIAAMFCNPIVIHSSVVFIRLYWFEKRFKDVVREARALRRTKTKSRFNTLEKDDPEKGRQERGVRGRAIQILHNTGSAGRNDPEQEGDSNGKAVDSSEDESKANGHADYDEDEVQLSKTRSTDEDVRLPQQLSPEQHIRFLEQQRNNSEGGALRIPSPREFERGGRPENVDELAAKGIIHRVTTNFDASDGQDTAQASPNAPRVGQHITINAPEVNRPRDKTSTFPRAASRQRTQNRENDEPQPLSQNRRPRTNTFSTFRRTNTARSMETTPYLSYEPTIGRNSFFVNLTEEQREELGGIEYRALKTLAMTLVLYFFCFHLLGIVFLVPWINRTATWGDIVRDQGQGRTWWGFFTSASLFNDLGFTITNNSMISFQRAVFPLLIGTFLIIIGNTGFPCMLRCCIWAASKVVPHGSGLWEEFKFLLDHPRRCFTLLFPGSATWWLFGILVVLNALDLIFFIVLDLKDPTVTSMPGGIRFLSGLFQAASTRTAGFSVVNLAELHPAIQVSYLIMMYISVFPIAISMRRTNVYEEKSLGIYASPSDDNEDGNEPSYVGAHLRKQLSFDLWYVFLGLFIIAIVEGGRLQNTNEYAFTIFSVLFEIISAYGTVGLSLGYPTINASFSGEFKILSKLIIIAMQIRGRHRGLPYELDRAVLLPSQRLHEKEAKEAQRQGQRIARRRSSVGTQISAVDGTLENPRFRPETGISSGVDPPQRSDTNNSLESRLAASHTSKARRGLGQAMFKLASAPDAIQENLTGGQERRGAVG